MTSTEYQAKLDEVLFKLRTTRDVEHNDNQWTSEFVYTLAEAKAALTKLTEDVVEEVIHSAKVTGSSRGEENIGLILSTISVMTKRQRTTATKILKGE